MKEIDRNKDLSPIKHHNILGESSLRSKLLEQFSALDELKHKIDVLLVLEFRVELDNKGEANLAKNARLVSDMILLIKL